MDHPNAQTAPSAAYSTSTELGIDGYEPQTMLILVGLPGSGKSTFAEALVRCSDAELMPSLGAPTAVIESGDAPAQRPWIRKRRRRWIRACQDETPSRRRQECESIVRRALFEGHNVVVDRVDFDPQQRAHFIAIADTLQPRPIVCALILQVSPACLQYRLSIRTDHPTIKDSATAARVLNEMNRLWRPPVPTRREGFDRIFSLGEAAQPPQGIWDAAAMLGVLERVIAEGHQERGHRFPPQVSSAPSERSFTSGRSHGYGYREPRGLAMGGSKRQ